MHELRRGTGNKGELPMKRTYSLRALFLMAALALLLLPVIVLGGAGAGLMVLNWEAIQSSSHVVDDAQADLARYTVSHWADLQGGATDRFADGFADLAKTYQFEMEIRALDNRVLFATPNVKDGLFSPQGFVTQPNQRVSLLQRGDQPLGVMTLWVWPAAALSRMGGAISAGLWAGAGTLVLLLVAALWWIGGAVLRPLRQLDEAAAAVARGSLEFSVPHTAVRELEGLSRSFAEMRDRMQTALDRQQSLEADRRRFLAAVGHDLRTPLSSIQAFAEGLRDGLARSPEKAEHYARVILEKSREMSRLVEDLFDFARLDLLEAAAQRQVVDGAAYLTSTAHSFQPVAAEKGVVLTADGPPLPLRIDPDLFARALSNLISNAIRHTPAGGSIALTWEASPTGRGALVRVTDTGEGIPAKELPMLFSPLHRTDSSRSRRSGGAGLGLAITARIVALHGGRITCESVLGQGSSFTIHLPG